MVLDDLKDKLEKGLHNLEASFDENLALNSLDELLMKMNSGQANVADFEQYGRIEHRLGDFYNLRDRNRFIRDYVLANLSYDEIDGAKKEANEYLEKIRDFVLRTKFMGEYDEKGAIITLQLGTNGVRTLNPFMRKLVKAHKNFAQDKEFFTEEIDDDEREISFVVRGSYSYGYFKGEHGVHRVIFEDEKGKRQTNYLTVIVEPLVESNGFTLKENEIKYEVLSASTPGGANANTGNTGIRLRHMPTGITAVSRRKSKNNNIKIAKEVLASRVAIKYKEREEKLGEKRVEPVRGNHFRTYSFAGKKFIRDDRTGYETDVDNFLSGNIKEFIYNFHGINFL